MSESTASNQTSRAGLVLGRGPVEAHDREHLGVGGRRVLVSRDWSGKTLAEHRADRAAAVREAFAIGWDGCPGD